MSDNENYREEDYYSKGEYSGYFVDINGRSFYELLHTYEDLSYAVSGLTPNEWVSFVQKEISYEKDEGGEVFYTAEELLERGRGDCEDTSLLLAKGLKYMGFKVAVVLLYKHAVCMVDTSADGYDSLSLSVVKEYQFPIWKQVSYVDDDGDIWIPIESTADVGVGVLHKDLDIYLWYDL